MLNGTLRNVHEDFGRIQADFSSIEIDLDASKSPDGAERGRALISAELPGV